MAVRDNKDKENLNKIIQNLKTFLTIKIIKLTFFILFVILMVHLSKDDQEYFVFQNKGNYSQFNSWGRAEYYLSVQFLNANETTKSDVLKFQIIGHSIYSSPKIKIKVGEAKIFFNNEEIPSTSEKYHEKVTYTVNHKNGESTFEPITLEFPSNETIKKGISKYKELILNQQQPTILKISIPFEIQEENYKNKEYSIIYKELVLEGEYRKEIYRKNHLKSWLNF